MAKLFLILACTVAVFWIDYLIETAPPKFRDPEPFAPIRGPRWPAVTKAGYRPKRRRA